MKRQLALSIGMSVGIIFCSAPTAIAQPVICKGNLGNISVQDVHVPAGQFCLLKGTRVGGNVIVNTNATLLAFQAKVEGSIISRNAKCIDLGSSTQIRGLIPDRIPLSCLFRPNFLN